LEVKFKKTFLKDLKRLPTDIREKIQHLAFVKLPSLKSISEIRELKKIKGYDKYSDCESGTIELESKSVMRCWFFTEFYTEKIFIRDFRRLRTKRAAQTFRRSRFSQHHL